MLSVEAINIRSGGRRPQRRSAETRARLVQAALHEFADHGFLGASTRAIANRAKIAQSAVPYHFTTKEALWRAAADSIFGLCQDRFRARISGLEGVDLPTRVRLLIREFVHFAAERPELHRLMMQEGTGLSERLEWLVATHVQPLVDYIRRMVEELKVAGYSVAAEPEHLIYMMIGAASTPYSCAAEFRLTTGKDPFSEEMVEAHAAAVVSLLAPDLDPPQIGAARAALGLD